MIVVASNREVNKKASDHTLFGEKPNKKGLDELRLAIAEYDKPIDRWKVKLLPENKKSIVAGIPPSQQLFKRILRDVTKRKIKGDWVVFVPGFNQSFLDNLIKCRHIENLYGINVLVFSWPSNQGGFKPNEYKKARAAAKGSSNAFDRMLEKLSQYLSLRPFSSDCPIRINLMAYSLGNYLLESFVRTPVFSSETKIFDNIILTQADVDLNGHIQWLGEMKYGKHLYVTINEDDSVLKWSDVVNPSRLGNTAKQLNAEEVTYFDFTGGRSVGKTHGLFYKTAKKNKVVRAIFQQSLIGEHAEKVDGIVFNSSSNAWELKHKD